MAFGAAVSNKFQIGTSEIRIGPMTLANQLTGVANSVGLLQSATVKFQQDSVDLEAGFPKTIVDTAIVKTNITVEAQAYEYSRRNIRSMLNEGSESVGAVLETSGTTTGNVTASTGTLFTIATNMIGSNLTAGDLVVIYPMNAPEQISVIAITAVTGTTTATITFDSAVTPLLFPSAIISGSSCYKANNIGIGKSSGTNYFTLDILGSDSTGAPKGFKFWKCAVAGSMDYSFSNDNYAVTPLNFKILKPSAADLQSGGPLYAIRNIVNANPFGMFFSG